MACRSCRQSSRVRLLYGMFWSSVFITAYCIDLRFKHWRRRPIWGAYFISEVLNCEDDTPALFCVRWALWLLYSSSTWVPFKAISSPRWAAGWILLFWMATVSGFTPRFAIEHITRSEVRSWAHRLGSMSIFFYAGILQMCGFGWCWSGVAWTAWATTYCVALGGSYLSLWHIDRERFLLFPVSEWIFFTYLHIRVLCTSPRVPRTPVTATRVDQQEVCPIALQESHGESIVNVANMHPGASVFSGGVAWASTAVENGGACCRTAAMLAAPRDHTATVKYR